MRLLLVPHASTDWNATGRFQGWSDTTLSDIGKREAALVARRLLAEHIAGCHTSDLRRAVDTANGIVNQRSVPIMVDPRLREIHFGAWEGMTYPQFYRADPQRAWAWEQDPLRIAPPGGETLAQVAERIAAFHDAVIEGKRNKAGRLLVVGHRGALRVLICLELGLPPSAWWQFRLEPASVSELDLCEKGAVLRLLNDTHHLREETHAG
jgi:broad specificity phosphatase PhoE